MNSHFMIVSGNVNRDLAMAIAQRMDVGVGKCRVARFSDTEMNVQLDEPARERRVFIIQSSCSPVDEHPPNVTGFNLQMAKHKAVANVTQAR